MVRQSIHDNWSLEALTDYHGSTLKYQDVAHDIEVLHLLFQCTGIKPGDKVALSAATARAGAWCSWPR